MLRIVKSKKHEVQKQIKTTDVSTPSCLILFPEEQLMSPTPFYYDIHLSFSITIPINDSIYWRINNLTFIISIIINYIFLYVFLI